MAGKLLTGVKRFILWDHARATWQYDVMVGLILAFVFLTPRQWFLDQPRMPRTSRIAMLQGGRGTTVYWVEAELLAGVPEADRMKRAGEMLRSRTGQQQKIVRLEAVFDSESVIKGYIAFTHP
jgi:hypothetical protein